MTKNILAAVMLFCSPAIAQDWLLVTGSEYQNYSQTTLAWGFSDLPNYDNDPSYSISGDEIESGDWDSVDKEFVNPYLHYCSIDPMNGMFTSVYSRSAHGFCSMSAQLGSDGEPIASVSNASAGTSRIKFEANDDGTASGVFYISSDIRPTGYSGTPDTLTRDNGAWSEARVLKNGTQMAALKFSWNQTGHNWTRTHKVNGQADDVSTTNDEKLSYGDDGDTWSFSVVDGDVVTVEYQQSMEAHAYDDSLNGNGTLRTVTATHSGYVNIDQNIAP